MKPRTSTLTLACLVVLLAWPAPTEARGPIKVAVLPLVVNSLGDHAYLQAGMADMLASRIGRQAGLAVVRVEDPNLATRRPETARDTARELGADFVVYGSFTAFGGGASLDLECSAVGDGKRSLPTRSGFIQAGELGDIIPQLDGVAEKIARFAASGGTDAPALVAAPPPVSAAPGKAAAPAAAPAPGIDPAELRALEARVAELERLVRSLPEQPLEEADLRRAPMYEDSPH